MTQEHNKNAPRNSFTISVTQELFKKGAPKFASDNDAKKSLAKAIKAMPEVQSITANTTNPEKFVCDVLMGTDALNIVSEATAILNRLYKICDQWAGLSQQANNSQSTV
jgi:hypothetical protein